MNLQILHTKDYPYHLLLLADPNEEFVNQYIDSSDCLIAVLENHIVGVIVVQKQNPELAEIMNLAVDESYQRKGIARRLLQHVCEEWTKDNHIKRLKVCTGTSGAGPLMLYQQEGFDLMELDRNYFVRHYPEPIWENGVQCKHRLILEKVIY